MEIYKTKRIGKVDWVQRNQHSYRLRTHRGDTITLRRVYCTAGPLRRICTTWRSDWTEGDHLTIEDAARKALSAWKQHHQLAMGEAPPTPDVDALVQTFGAR